MKRMTLKIFERNLLLYGADLHLWAGYDVRALRVFMQQNEKALALYLEGQSLDAQLDDFTVPALNMDVVRAAKAQIIRDTGGAQDAATRKASSYSHAQTGLWSGAFKPAYALASLCVVALIVTLLSFGGFGRSPTQSAASFDLASALNEIETLAAQSETQQELIVAFAEIEKEQAINSFMDYIILEFDEGLMEDAAQYLHQEG
jgi:hypothetical protein